MDSNTHSTGQLASQATRQPASPLAGLPVEQPDGLTALTGAIEVLAAQDLDSLSDTVRAERVLGLRQLVNRLEGLWLQELAELDAGGAAGADHGEQAPSTAAWLRNRLRLGAGVAHSTVRTARALFRGPLPQTAEALVAGDISPAHAKVVADGTHQLPAHAVAAADSVLVETARRLDPPQLRRAVGYLCQVADPEGADRAREHRHARRGLWLSPTWEGMVAVDGLLEPEAGATVLAALEPLARPAGADDTRKGGQRTADALTELARRALEGGRLPTAGGVRPQLLVTVELESLLGRSGSLVGEAGSVGRLDREACRRLACDGTVTRVVVNRQPTRGGQADPSSDNQQAAATGDLHQEAGVGARLRNAMAVLPPVLGGAPSQPLDVGRSTRVVHPAQRAALAVRDQGCVFPGCERPLAWCDAHHLVHWVDGGPTDLANLALLCRGHHREVHEGGWRLIRGPDGRFTATPPHRRHHIAA